MKVQGQVARGFERVREAFERNFATDNDCPETGAAFAAIHRGDVIVDLWGGFADAAQTRPWQRDTMVNTYSTTKGVAAICMAVLEGRGLIDYEERVSHYWPEFAAAGKGDITVGMMLSHRGGLSGVRERLTVDDLLDWEKVTRLLAAAEPLWTPGSVAGYHAITWGFLAGELARRVLGGTSLREFLQKDVAQPLAASYHIGTPEALLPKIAELIPPRGVPHQTQAPPSEILKLTLMNPYIEAGMANRREIQLAELAALNGTGTALGLATMYAPFANDGSHTGVRLLSEDAIERATTLQFHGMDMNLGKEARWFSAGFFGNNAAHWYGPNVDAFGHSGWGGSMGYADRTAHVSVGYVMNQMDANLNGDPRSLRLVDALYSALRDTD